LKANQFNRWQALNPALYLISLLPGLAVVLLAGQQSYWLTGLSLATLAVVFLQHAINVINDLSDWRLGADAEKMDSWVRFHQQNMRVVASHGFISFLLGGFLGLAVLHISGQYWLLLIAAPLILLGYFYNAGEKPLSYTWVGEWVTGICYGPGVFGCLWLVSGQSADTTYVLGSVAFAALSVALLLSHQPPQIETDRAAGKLSFAVRYGVKRTQRTARDLFVVCCLAIMLALYLSASALIVQTAYVSTSIVAVIVVYRLDPQPKIMLLAGSFSIVLAVILSIVVY